MKSLKNDLVKLDLGYQQRKVTLIKSFCNLIDENILDLDQEKLVELVKTACKEAKSADGFTMQYIQALRILSTFDFNILDKEYSTIQTELRNLYGQQEIKSEIHHLKKTEDLHFYMVKITGKNAQEWASFSKEQMKSVNKKGIKDIKIGLNAFIPSLAYHDQDLTDTYVAFIANKPLDKTNMPNSSSIEMIVTMMTSEHAYFTSHAGIARTATYEGVKHKNISTQLHSFIAACTQDIYREKKEYMITPPAEVMRDIIIHAFSKNNASEKIFIGHQDTPVSDKSIDVLKLWVDYYKDIKDEKTQNGTFRDYDEENYFNALLELNLSKQKELWQGKKAPIKLVKSKEESAVIIYGKKGEILNNISSNEMEGEFAWFCKSPYLLPNQHSTEPLITCDLNTLARLETPSGVIEHSICIENIGDAIPYSEYPLSF